MKLLITLVSIMVISISAQGKPPGQKKLYDSIENQTNPIQGGLTIPNHLELRWKNKNELPSSIRLKNPFKEDFNVFTSKIDGSTGYPELEIECYDTKLKEWRSPAKLSGSFDGTTVKIQYGQHKDFQLSGDFWWFVTERLPLLTFEKTIRIRLVDSLGEVSLRSDEFVWTLVPPQPKTKKANKNH